MKPYRYVGWPVGNVLVTQLRDLVATSLPFTAPESVVIIPGNIDCLSNDLPWFWGLRLLFMTYQREGLTDSEAAEKVSGY